MSEEANLPSGWTELLVEDAVENISTNGKKTPQKQYLESGRFPIVDQGQELIGGFTDDANNLVDCEPPAIVFGDHTKVVKLINHPFAPGADGVKVLKPHRFFDVRAFKILLDHLAADLIDKGYARHYQHLAIRSIPLPPLAEQRRIVAKIEELFSELDAGEESLRRARRQLGVYRQSLLKQAFEGKLTNRQLADGTLPKKWHSMTLRQACENIKVGIVIQPTQYYSKDEDGIKAFRSANVREFRIEDSNWVYFSKSGNDANPRTQLKTNDVLIVRSGYPGTSCVVTPAFEGCNAIDILIATPHQQILRSDYLCAFNNSPLAKGLFNKGSRGVAQKHLNVGVYGGLTIPVPPLDEQREIVRLLDEQFTVIEQNEREIDAALKRSAVLRQSILKKAFTGQLVPQDPTDEPASALLERIREERQEAALVPKKKTARKKTVQNFK